MQIEPEALHREIVKEIAGTLGFTENVKQRAKVSSIGVETASKLTTCYPAGFDRRHLE